MRRRVWEVEEVAGFSKEEVVVVVEPCELLILEVVEELVWEEDLAVEREEERREVRRGELD